MKPKPQKVEKFVNFGLKIHRTEKELQKNEFAALIYNNQENISKFEIRQYLEKSIQQFIYVSLRNRRQKGSHIESHGKNKQKS